MKNSKALPRHTAMSKDHDQQLTQRAVRQTASAPKQSTGPCTVHPTYLCTSLKYLTCLCSGNHWTPHWNWYWQSFCLGIFGVLSIGRLGCLLVQLALCCVGRCPCMAVRLLYNAYCMSIGPCVSIQLTLIIMSTKLYYWYCAHRSWLYVLCYWSLLPWLCISDVPFDMFWLGSRSIWDLRVPSCLLPCSSTFQSTWPMSVASR